MLKLIKGGKNLNPHELIDKSDFSIDPSEQGLMGLREDLKKLHELHHELQKVIEELKEIYQ